MRRFRIFFVPCLAAALWALGASVEAQEQCSICHPVQRVEHRAGIHAREEVGCTSCHGGDAAATRVEAAHRGSFRNLRDRGEVAASCAECHADLQRMRPYNLPVDQYALYLTSKHGLAMARGEERAAVCTDCHGVHEVRSADDPKSPVYTRNLPATCGGCHGDPSLMADFGLDAGVVEEYRTSLHGRALFDRGNLAAPNCTSCHGVHGAAPPGVGDVDKVCGSCHRAERRAFLESPHLKAMRAEGLAECAACHSNHAIVRREDAATLELCLDCHQESSAQVDIGRKIHALIRAAEEDIEEAEALVARAEEVPLHVEGYRGRLEEARTYVTEARSLVHTVALEPVEAVTRRARSIGEEVQHELYPKLEQRSAHLGLAAFWFYLVMTLAILFNYKRRLARGDGRPGATTEEESES